MKYLILKTKQDNEIPVIFPATVPHCVIAEGLPDLKPVSAGFIYFGATADGTVRAVCNMHSQTLGIASREQDADIVTREMNRV